MASRGQKSCAEWLCVGCGGGVAVRMRCGDDRRREAVRGRSVAKRDTFSLTRAAHSWTGVDHALPMGGVSDVSCCV